MELNKREWTSQDYQELMDYLILKSDKEYLLFSKKLIETTDTMLGIRVPLLKKMAKEISLGNYLGFLKLNTTSYYETKLLEGFIIGNIKDSKEALLLLEDFLPKIDNWSTCDTTISNMKWIKKNREVFFGFIQNQFKKKDPWITRFCFVVLLNYYLDKDYLKIIFTYVEKYYLEHYYVKMAIAWLISYCYIKYPKETINYLQRSALDTWTFNKSIQKIRESKRVDIEEKKKLNEMKR